MCDIETSVSPINSNENWLVGNKENIFIISSVNGNYTIQELKQPLSFSIPDGFTHPDFQNLVELNFKNFTSYLLYESLNTKLSPKIKTKFSKI